MAATGPQNFYELYRRSRYGAVYPLPLGLAASRLT